MWFGTPLPTEMILLNPASAVKDVMVSFSALYTDPWCIPSAFLAGLAARLSITPLVGYRMADKYTTAFSVARQRALYFTVLSWMYFPVHRRTQWNEFSTPNMRFFRLATCGFFAGAISRFVTNPLIKARVVSLRYGMDLADAARNIRMSDLGSAAFFTNEHPVLVNGLYISVFFIILEGTRRLLESLGMYPSGYLPRAVCHATLAGVSAAAASTLTYSLSYRSYHGALIRDSAVLQGRLPLLLKEVPLMSSFFLWFSLLQPIFAPHHERCGLGY